MKHYIVGLVAASALILTLTACSPTATATSPSASVSHSAQADLTIENFEFSAVTVKAGASFTVHNADSADHTLNIAGTGIDLTVNAGETVTVMAPAKAGSYRLTCDFHKTMVGTLKVTE